MVNAGTCNRYEVFYRPWASRHSLPGDGSVLYWPNLLTLPIKAPYGTKGFGTQCADKAAKVRTLIDKCPRGARMAWYTCGQHASVHSTASRCWIIDTDHYLSRCARHLKELHQHVKTIIAEFTKSLYIWVMLVTSEKGTTSTECLSKVSTDRGQAGKDCNVLKHRCN